MIPLQKKNEKNEKNENNNISLEELNEKIVGLDFVNENFEQSLSDVKASQLINSSSEHNVYYQNLTNPSELVSDNNEKTQKSTKSTQKQNKPSELAFSLLDFFYESLVINIPTQRSIPGTPKKRTEMARHFDEMIKTYQESEIRDCINYGHSDAFWKNKGIIKNPKKLEEHIGTLLTQLRGQSDETIKGNIRKPSTCKNATFKPNPKKFLDANAEQ